MGCGWNPLCHAARAAEAVGDAVKDVVDEIADTIEDAVEDVLSTVFDSMSDVAAAVAAVVQKFGEAVVGFVTVAGQQVYLLGEALGSGLDYALHAVVDAGVLLAGEIYSYAGELVGFVVDGILWLADTVVSVAEAAAQAVELLGEFAWDAVTLNSEIFKNLWGNFVDIVSATLKVYETVVKGVFQIAGQIYELTGGRLSGYLAGLLSNIPLVGGLLSDVVRCLNDINSFLLNFAELIASLPTTLACVFSGILNEEADLHALLPSLLEYPESMVACGRLQVLGPPSATCKYAVMSDIHTFFDSELDYYHHNDVTDLHRRLLSHLAQQGYHLIENGDVEDLWRRDSGDLDQRGSIAASQTEGLKAQFRKIVENNQDLYSLIQDRFESKGRYSRVVGNHDLPLLDPGVHHEFRKTYPSTMVAEFILIGDGSSTPSHLIAHGHQIDQFNRPGCEWFGESMTRLVSRWDMVFDMAEHISASDEDTKPIFRTRSEYDHGRKNVLSAHRMLGFAQLDEPALFRQFVRLNERMELPWIILGHSHDPRYMPGYEDGGEPVAKWAMKEGTGDTYAAGAYANTGTTGMWKGIVWFVTIEAEPSSGKPVTLLHAARLSKSQPSRGGSVSQLEIATFMSDGPSEDYGDGDGDEHVGLLRIAV